MATELRYFFSFLFLVFPLLCFPQQQEKYIVHFEFNKYDLDTTSQRIIQDAILIKAISAVSIEAHCDSIGNNKYNDNLSMLRAKQVKEYLISKNIDEKLIVVKGFGKKLPLNKNESEQNRALNRRAEILITFISPAKIDSSESSSKALPESSDTLSELPELDLQHAEVGSTVRLENINFYGGRHIWLPRSENTLKKLLKTLQENPTLEIEIQGHVCCIESGDGPDFDEPGSPNRLSVNRAKAIYDYLVRHRIDKSRLSYRGFGSDYKLVMPEITEYDRQTNRRVEIKIIRK